MTASVRPGSLVLIPTPIDDQSPLEPVAHDLLLQASQDPRALILVEEHKAARQRWLGWGLPKEAISKFILLNEHTAPQAQTELIRKIQKASATYVLSDCGLPAFCDPGQELVDHCRRAGVHVTASPFPNSVLLAAVLSGFPNEPFYFQGFLPQKQDEKEKRLAEILKTPDMLILMDTPYRLQKSLEDLRAALHSQRQNTRQVFLAQNLNQSEESCLRGSIQEIQERVPKDSKAEFILVLAPRDFRG